MARDLNVEEMIEAELQRDARARPEDLHFLAGRIDPALADLSLAQFKARFLSADSTSADTTAPRTRKRRGPAKRSSRRKKVTAAKRGARQSRRTATPSADASMATAPPANGLEAERVRSVLNRFARDLAAAEEPGQVIKVMAGLDRYVRDIVGG